jgi:sirohydrochlorin cobaltochelatase
MKQGLLLLAHGARNPAWAQPFQALAARVSAMRPDIVVSLGFLELMTPNVEEALSSLHAQGAEQVEVLPMFLGGAGHVQRDVLPLVEAAGARLGCAIRLHAALGEQPAMLDAMSQLCLRLLDPPEAA